MSKVAQLDSRLKSQRLLEHYAALPVGLRALLLINAERLHRYADTLDPFCRNYFAPPEDILAPTEWERELLAEMKRSLAGKEPRQTMSVKGGTQILKFPSIQEVQP